MPEKHRGRPTSDNPKTMRVDVRLTEEELKMRMNIAKEWMCRARKGYVTG